MSSENEISNADFVDFCYKNGEGKYILGQRGKGIRGFKKITDCLVEGLEVSDWKTFAAEEISVKQNVKLNTLNDKDLLDLMHSMSDVEVKTAEDFGKFKADLKNIHSEISNRGLGHSTIEKNAEPLYGMAGGSGQGDATMTTQPKLNLDQPIAGAGFMAGNSGVAMGFVGGILVGMVGTMYYYKSKMDGINTELERINKQLNEAESSIKRAESREKKAKASKEAVKQYDSKMSLDAEFLSTFNRNQGPMY